jgi:photosystem II stability/assembly factor-like uncharacterized protein
MTQHSDRAFLIAVILCAAVIFGVVEMRSASAECQWDTLATAPMAGRVDDMFFRDADTGWCVNSSGQIWFTDDGGDTWAKQFQSMSYLRAIAFVDDLHGWAGVLDPAPKMYKTVDGGANWTAAGLPPGNPGRICGMTAVDESTLVACGAYDGTPGYYMTTDVGASWTARDLSSEVSSLIDVFFHDPLNGFLVGGADGDYPDDVKPVVLQTTDGGTTWTRRYTGTTSAEWCWKIFFLDDDIGFVTVENYAAASVLKTIDGGATWQEYDVPGVTDIQAVGFVDENLGWVGGWEGTAESNNGGVTWNSDDWGLILNRFVRISPTLLYASGATVYRYTCGPSAVREPSAPYASPLALQCHPNPFNASTTITFDVPVASRVVVRIYDALGKQVVELLDSDLQAGPQRIPWDGRNNAGNEVASGVYLYRVDASGTAESKSMVLVK